MTKDVARPEVANTILNKLRQKHSITIWCNPRGIFLSVHLDDTNDGVADIDSKKFTHLNEIFDFLAEMADNEST